MGGHPRFPRWFPNLAQIATRSRTKVLPGALRPPGSKRYLTESGLHHVMVVMRRISGAGRGLLALGAALLLVSLFGSLVLPSTYVTWFTLSGNQPALPAGSYTGIQATELLNTLVSGPYLWIAFGSILVCVAAAIAIAGIGERTRHFGTFGIIVLLLYAALLYIAAYQYNQQAPAGDAAISIGYGLIVAVVACVLIEAGARLPSAVPTRPRVPAVAAGREKA